VRSLDSRSLCKLSLRHSLLFTELGNALAYALSGLVHFTYSSLSVIVISYKAIGVFT
jgi:hypothetical protein